METTSFLRDSVDSGAILADIRRIVEIESPSRNVAGVNRVLEAIASFFEGTGAVCERQLTTPTLGDILRVRCDSTRSEPGVLVLSHMDTVHPVGTLPYRYMAWVRKRNAGGYAGLVVAGVVVL
jgi:glutamate carboxypeptidase